MSHDDRITNEAIEAIAKILAEGYVRYRLKQREGPAEAPPVEGETTTPAKTSPRPTRKRARSSDSASTAAPPVPPRTLREPASAVPDSMRAAIAARLEKLAKMTVKELRAEYVAVFGQRPTIGRISFAGSPGRFRLSSKAGCLRRFGSMTSRRYTEWTLGSEASMHLCSTEVVAVGSGDHDEPFPWTCAASGPLFRNIASLLFRASSTPESRLLPRRLRMVAEDSYLGGRAPARCRWCRRPLWRWMGATGDDRPTRGARFRRQDSAP